MTLHAEPQDFLTCRDDLSVLARANRGLGLLLRALPSKTLQKKLQSTGIWRLTGPPKNIAAARSLLPPGGPLSPDGRRLGGSGCKRDVAACSLLPPPPGESGQGAGTGTSRCRTFREEYLSSPVFSQWNPRSRPRPGKLPLDSHTLGWGSRWRTNPLSRRGGAAMRESLGIVWNMRLYAGIYSSKGR